MLGTELGYPDRRKLGDDKGSKLISSDDYFDGSFCGNFEGAVSVKGDKIDILEGAEDETRLSQANDIVMGYK